MNEPTQQTKDPVTLDALKRAIEKVERYKRAPLNEALHNAVGWCAAERDTWRTAFEWHVGLIKRHAGISEELAHLTEWVAIDREEEEGMALIREKLQS